MKNTYTYYRAVGKAHKENHLPCQDYITVRDGPQDYLIAALGDGLSSAKHSETGAKIACQTAVDLIAKSIPHDTTDEFLVRLCLFNAAAGALGTVIRTAERTRRKPEDYDTTLHLVLFNTATGTAHTLNAGDGAVIGLTKDGRLESTDVKSHQGRRPGSVYPLSSGYQTWKYEKLDNLASLLMTSDGLLAALQPELLKKFAGMDAYPKLILPLLDSRAHFSRREHERYIHSFVKRKIHEDDALLAMELLMEVAGVDDIDARLERMANGEVDYIMSHITDDTSMAVLMAKDTDVDYTLSVFDEPDLRELADRQYRLLYPDGNRMTTPSISEICTR